MFSDGPARLDTHLIKYSILKFGNILLGLLQGIAQAWVITYTFDGGELSFLFFIFGLVNYFALFDFGIGRPIYSHLRSIFISSSGHVPRELINEHAALFIALSGIVSILFAIVATLTSLFWIVPFSLSTIFLLGFSMGLAVSLQFFKELLDAIDMFSVFEMVEIARRSTLLFGSALVLFDKTLFLMSVFQLLSLAILFFVILNRISFPANTLYEEIRWRKLRKLLSPYKADMLKNLGYRINETLIYNWGYLVFPWYSNAALTLYAIWQRIFQGLAVPLRAIPEVVIHPLTRFHYKKQKKQLRAVFFGNLLVTSGLASLALVVLSFSKDWLSTHWLNNQISITSLLVFITGIWIWGNLIQHPSGRFLAGIGGNFPFMFRISLLVATTTFFVALTGLFLLGLGAEILLLVVGIIYFLGALTYFSKVASYWKT